MKKGLMTITYKLINTGIIRNLGYLIGFIACNLIMTFFVWGLYYLIGFKMLNLPFISYWLAWVLLFAFNIVKKTIKGNKNKIIDKRNVHNVFQDECRFPPTRTKGSAFENAKRETALSFQPSQSQLTAPLRILGQFKLTNLFFAKRSTNCTNGNPEICITLLLDFFSIVCYNNNVIRKGGNKMPYYKALLHYGEIVSNYKNEKDNIEVTIFLYNNEKYRVVKYKGIVQSIVKLIYDKN